MKLYGSRKRVIKDDYEIKYSDTVESLFGKTENRDHNELKENPVYMDFQKKFRAIHEAGNKSGCYDGQTLQIVVNEFGFRLEKLQWGLLDSVILFMQNVRKKYQFIDKEQHELLNSIGYYDKSPTGMAHKALFQGTMRAIREGLNVGRSNDYFIKMGIEISKQ